MNKADNNVYLNESIDFWHFTVGCNVIPVLSNKKPTIRWSDFQYHSMSDEDYRSMTEMGYYDQGCAVITGKIWRGPMKDKYLVCFDFDNHVAIDVFLYQTHSLFGCKTLDELSQKTIVEEHEDAKGKRAHVYIITSNQITKHNRPSKTQSLPDMEIPELEVKSDSSTYVVCSPTVHMNGYPYEIIGTREPYILDRSQSDTLEKQIAKIYASCCLHSTNSNSSLSPELKLIANTLKIGANPAKISEGSRNSKLVSLTRVILNRHYNTKDIQDLKLFIEEVNQKLCDPPLPEKELDNIWKQDLKYLVNDLEDGKIGLKKHKQNENRENNIQYKLKPKFLTYKYTLKGQLYEAIILEDKPFFLTVKDGQAILKEFLEEDTRILSPPALEEYPSYVPYSFKDIEEITKFIDSIKSQDITIDDLFAAYRKQISLYVVHHDYVLDYVTAIILFSYFQDRSPTVPYTMFVSDNGSGKSTIGNVFECFGYRCVNMTDPTTANIFRIFGTIEPGQCALILDEAEKIDQEKDMMGVLKTGYENGKKVQRINPFGKQEHFHAFGLKIMLAERTPNPFYAKGVLDRTFVISNFRGCPDEDIKEIKNSKKGKKEFSFYKNLLLVYRLMYIDKTFQEIDTGLIGRDKELCKPLLQLFFGTKYQFKIIKTLEILLDEKNSRKANSLEREILEVVRDLIDTQYKDGIIPIPRLWDEIIKKTNATKKQYDELTVTSSSHGSISKYFVLKMARDRFGAKDKRITDSRCLFFNYKNVLSNYEEYVKEEQPTRIICKPIVNNDTHDANDANIESLFKSFGKERQYITYDTSPIENIEGETNLKSPDVALDSPGELEPSSTICTKGLENSVIPVIPVIETPVKRNIEKDNFKNQINYGREIYRKWEGSDIWGCHNCNVRGDIWYMQEHRCKGINSKT